MKNLLPMILLIFSTSLFVACTPEQRQFALDTVSVSAALVQLDAQYAAARDFDLVQFDATEQARLRNAMADIDELRETLQQMLSNGGGVAALLVDADRAAHLLAHARTAYRTAADVVSVHFDDLSPGKQAQLKALDANARRLSGLLDSLTTTPDGTDITGLVRDALTLAAAVASVTQAEAGAR
jgi:prefoldin subunit 5